MTTLKDLNTLINDDNATAEQIAQAAKEIDWSTEIERIRAERAKWDKEKADFARECGAKTADEWTRDKFQCFIRRAPELDKLSTSELRALFLIHSYKPIHGKSLYKRVANFNVWKKWRRLHSPNYGLAGNGGCTKEEVKKLTDIWHTL